MQAKKFRVFFGREELRQQWLHIELVARKKWVWQKYKRVGFVHLTVAGDSMK